MGLILIRKASASQFEEKSGKIASVHFDIYVYANKHFEMHYFHDKYKRV